MCDLHMQYFHWKRNSIFQISVFFFNPRVSPSAGYMWVPYTDTIVVVVSDVAKATAKAVPALPEEQRVAPLKKLRLGLVAPWEVDGESSHCAVWLGMLKVC